MRAAQEKRPRSGEIIAKSIPRRQGKVARAVSTRLVLNSAPDLRQHVANDPGSLSKAADISAQAISKHGMFKGDLRCRYPNRSNSPTAPRTSASWRPGAGRPGLCSSTGWRHARDWPGWMSVRAMAPSLSSFLRGPRLRPFARSIPPTHRLQPRARKYRQSRSSCRLATRWHFLTSATASTSR